MTAAGLYRDVTALLEKAGCDSPAFDAACLLNDIGHIPSHDWIGGVERAVTDEAVSAVQAAAVQRAAGRPLQYILGEWDFLRLTLSVGEGVLVPRPDTECLCEWTAQWLRTHTFDTPVRVLDLCAGSGCVGMGIASLCAVSPDVTAVELSEAAWPFLTRNIARYPQYAVHAVRADVLHDATQFAGGFAVVVSNPPYIPTADLDGLMREVQHEPRMALDGDTDGLRFYRVIATQWVEKLLPGGLCAVEVGAGQAEAVQNLFRAAGLCAVEAHPDLAGILRVVTGEKPR